jgi:hypothetical protein
MLPETSGYGVTFTQFASWVRDRRFWDIETHLGLTAPSPWVREGFLRRWWAFYLSHLREQQRKAEGPRRRKKLLAIASRIIGLESNSTHFPEDLLSLEVAHTAVSKLADAADGRPPMSAFERLVFDLFDAYRQLMQTAKMPVTSEHWLRFIELNVDVLKHLEAKLSDIAFRMPRTRRQILRHLRRIGARAEQTYSASKPPEVGSAETLPDFKDLCQDPDKAARRMAYNIIDTFKRGDRP